MVVFLGLKSDWVNQSIPSLNRDFKHIKHLIVKGYGRLLESETVRPHVENPLSDGTLEACIAK